MEVFPSGRHSHGMTNIGTKPTSSADAPAHSHDLQGNTDNTGLGGPARTTGGPLMFIDDLQIGFDGSLPLGNPITAAVRAVITGNPAKIGDAALGIGDPFVTAGVEIDLLQVAGADLKEGPHFFTFSVKPGGGGKLHYNLYID